ncbi:Vitamin B12 import ATP-binding protein BtuD [Candidatus Lokiarchaeum ossiferum]|uniref:Vitamin B12 import ATP-binding protein BtuD n=1 Tax=Candidatus Lokiarchaeum ossiferum TaxID=2951803 RepID=A0ABY6HYV2_9ARCH|nr:Vitamin B12 import ATP-binding protein BtuD [Candidatus Lokiarchaeum sp. B-35]
MINKDESAKIEDTFTTKASNASLQSLISQQNYQLDIVQLKNYSFRYGNSGPFALKNINLNISSGKTLLIGGVSGSGKSTLCNTIAGRIPFNITGQYSGEFLLQNRDIWAHDQENIARDISYVFQNADEQLVTFTVFDEIAFAAENLNISKKETQLRVNQIAEDLGITKLLKRSIFSLSGGEKQKVILAANLVMNPKILILDEPLAFLDSHGEIRFLKILNKLRRINPDLTIIIVEHRLQPFMTIVDQILVLNHEGSIDFQGNPQKYLQYKLKSPKIHLRDDSSIKKYESSSNLTDLGTQTKAPASNREEVIRIDDVTFSYTNTFPGIFSNFSLKINSGEFIGLVGDNGSGKTTLLYLIAHMLEPSSGKLYFNGQEYGKFDLDSFIPKIGFIFQNPENQIFESTIKDEILFAPRNFVQNFKKTKSKQADHQKNKLSAEEEEKISHLYTPLIGEKRSDLQILEDKNPFCLSWGQKRRLNLASIFSYNPDLLLVDEPFIGQDAQSMQRIFEILHEFHKLGKTIVIVSHDRELLKANCSRIIELKEKTNHIDAISNQKKLINNDQTKKKTKETKKQQKKHRKISRINIFLHKSSTFDETSWIYQLNPVVKLLILIVLTFFLFYQRSIFFLAICYGVILIIAKLGGIPSKRLLRQIRWVIMLTFIYIPLNTLFDANNLGSDQVLFYIFTERLPVRRLALYYSLRTGFLIIIFVSTAVIFTRTTAPKDLVYSLIEIGIPYRYAFSFMIGLRYIPLIEQESNTIEIAQTLRGSGIKKGNSIKKIYRHILQRITTLLISIIRKAKTTASTIEARGFGLNSSRTNIYHVGWSNKDWICLISFFLIILLNFLLLKNKFIFNFHLPSLYSIYQLVFMK